MKKNIVLFFMLVIGFISQLQGQNYLGKWEVTYSGSCLFESDTIVMEKLKKVNDTISVFEINSKGKVNFCESYWEDNTNNNKKVHCSNRNICPNYSEVFFVPITATKICFHLLNFPERLSPPELKKLSKEDIINHFSLFQRKTLSYRVIQINANKFQLVR